MAILFNDAVHTVRREYWVIQILVAVIAIAQGPRELGQVANGDVEPQEVLDILDVVLRGFLKSILDKAHVSAHELSSLVLNCLGTAKNEFLVEFKSVQRLFGGAEALRKHGEGVFGAATLRR
jgi:hypothetical protein